jgi:hypothetical protein
VTLSAERRDGSWHVTGVTTDGGSAPLGRWHFNVGAHWIGFDDDFTEPLIMRAYYDPKAETTKDEGYRYAGYMQFLRISFRDVPIPPEVFGGRLADRQPYARVVDKFRFVDFMGPADAIRFGIDRPFYALNARLGDPTLTKIPDDYEKHPLANGSLYVRNATGPATSACASIVSEVTPGLLTRAHIAAFLKNRTAAQVLQIRSAAVQGREPYRIVLDTLGATGGPLAGLDEGTITARAIGDYVLLTLDDDEDLGETLVIRGEPWSRTGLKVTVHVLTDYELQDLEAALGREAMRGIRDHLEAEGWKSSIPPATGRGTNGLLGDSFGVAPTSDQLTLVYTTLAYGVHPGQGSLFRSNKELSGFVWRAGYSWNEDTGRLSLATVVAPEKATIGQKDMLLASYSYACRSRERAKALVDPYEFTTATMRRQRFGGGDPVAFVTEAGEPIIP